jgi:hypothetical protein
MRGLVLLFVFILAVSTFSCKKENVIHNGNGNMTLPNYSNLAVGNYWIYQHFIIDEAEGTETALEVYDSCYVEKDTLINGYIYHKLICPSMLSENRVKYLRDSLHYIIDSAGLKVFSYTDFTTIFKSYFILASENDTACQVIVKMDNYSQRIETPAGIFTALNLRETYYMYPNWSFNGNERYINHFYSEGIGIVKETLPIFASDPRYRERRLVRYLINNF